jgi:F0F1-type ATP synthase assembly protein I
MAAESPGWSELLGMGVVIAAELAVGIVLGLVVDSAAGTGPIFLLVGLLIGVVAAVSSTVMKFRKYLKT